MSKTLTLSVVIPREKINKSLVLSLVDADSHFYSMRYKSLEFVIVDDFDNEETDLIVENLSKHVPSILKTSSNDLHENISGENVIVVHHESAINFDALDSIRKLLKDDVRAGVMSHDDSAGLLDKITKFLLRILGFKESIDASEYPFLIYLHRDLIKDFSILETHSVITNFGLSETDYTLHRHDKLSKPSIKHYLKVWWHLISVKFKKVWSDLKIKLKNRYNNYEK